jgi:hypothetical protein
MAGAITYSLTFARLSRCIDMPLISLHMPKAAGTSFQRVLAQAYGEGLRLDYTDLPVNTARPQREWAALRTGLRLRLQGGLPPAVDCVHGHFLPLKYRFLPSRQSPVFVTWLREPVERLISHYHYWMRAGQGAELPALHRRVVQEQWTLERFCLAVELRNLYHQLLFAFPLRRLAFVGIVERAEADFERFSHRYLGGKEGGLPRENVGFAGESSLGGGTLRRRIEAFHQKDMALYHYFRSSVGRR